MALLRNNNVYIFSISSIQAWYHSYIHHVVRPLIDDGDIHLSTFQEDIQVLLKRMNGVISQHRYNEYIETTSGNIDIIAERFALFETLWDMVQGLCWKVFPEYPGAPSTDIFFHFDKECIYVLDRRKMTYVPNGLCHTVSATGGEPLLNDDAWS